MFVLPKCQSILFGFSYMKISQDLPVLTDYLKLFNFDLGRRLDGGRFRGQSSGPRLAARIFLIEVLFLIFIPLLIQGSCTRWNDILMVLVT